MENKIRVRFAPSPTGYLHIGSARTALFNYLFARANKGEFILRIEDTDTTRSKKEYLDEILESLRWLGLEWDGELTYQSKRLDLYKKFADKLLGEGKAYKDGDAIIFKMPEEVIKIDDKVHGLIEFDPTLIKDQVLMKSDGFPTYNFACVIDDNDMGMTHIIRGDDHISNTPKQIALYKALDFGIPHFAHIPLILSEDRSRMSKRFGATAIKDYKAEGFLPEAMLNFLSLLGWAPGNNQEIMSKESVIKNFSLKKINKTGAVFGMDKLRWINLQYMKRFDPGKLVDMLIPRLKEAGFIKDDFDRNWLMALVKLYQGRIYTLGEFLVQTDFFFKDDYKIDEEGVNTYLKGENIPKIFTRLIEKLEILQNFDIKSIETEARLVVDEFGLKGADLIHPVRVAVSGRTVSAGLFEIMALLGKEKVIKRLKKFTN